MRMWMSPPPMWREKPRSHRTRRTTKIVQSTDASLLFRVRPELKLSSGRTRALRLSAAAVRGKKPLAQGDLLLKLKPPCAVLARENYLVNAQLFGSLGLHLGFANRVKEGSCGDRCGNLAVEKGTRGDVGAVDCHGSVRVVVNRGASQRDAGKEAL